MHAELWRLPPVHDRLHDVRRHQGQPQHATDIGRVDFLGHSDLGDDADGAALRYPSPAECPRLRLDHCAVDLRPRYASEFAVGHLQQVSLDKPCGHRDRTVRIPRNSRSMSSEHPSRLGDQRGVPLELRHALALRANEDETQTRREFRSEGAEGSSRSCPCRRHRSMPKLVPPQMQAVGRQSWRHQLRCHRNDRRAHAGERSPRRTSCASWPILIVSPGAVVSALSDAARACTPQPSANGADSGTLVLSAPLVPPNAARKPPNPTRSPARWLSCNATMPGSRNAFRAPRRSLGSTKKLRSCWASRWHPATASLDRCCRRTRAGRRYDGRGLLRARGFTRQRAAKACPSDRAAGEPARTTKASSGTERSATAGGAGFASRATLR